MNILFAVHHFPPRFTGGTEWEVWRTARALQDRGHRVRVVSIEDVNRAASGSMAWVDDVFDGVKVRRLSLTLAPESLELEYDNQWIGEQVSRMFAEERPDIFHLFGGYLISARPLRVARAYGIPNIVTLMDFWFLCPRISMLRSNGDLSTLPIDARTCARCLAEEKRRYRLPATFAPPLMRLFWRLERRSARRIEARMAFLRQALGDTDLLVSRSQFLRTMFIDAGIPAERIIFLRQGMEDAAQPAVAVEKTASPVLRIGYLGQIAPHKGVHVLLEAVRRLPGAAVRVTIYGDLDPFPAYVRRLARLCDGDPRLVFGSAIRTRVGLTALMQNLDVIVVPSTYYENSPNVIVEAFAHRTPVMASNLGGMAELVQHEHSGLLFQPGDPEDLARQVRRLLDEPELIAHLRAGIPPVKGVAEEALEWEAIYDRVTRQPER